MYHIIYVNGVICVAVLFCLFFFFFFKQKTAYEMRISDWSSDVCSSDLCSSPLRRHCRADWPPRRDNNSATPPIRPDSRAGHRPRQAPRAPPYCPAPRTPACSAARPPSDNCPPSAPHAPPRARSEEHTSELQSLMRLSYAGLFLKQKPPPTMNDKRIHYI